MYIDEQNALRGALAAGDPATLTLLLVQLTGNRLWLERARPFVSGPLSYHETMPEALRAEVRDALFEELTVRATGDCPPITDRSLMVEMMSFAAGAPVPDDYVDLMEEELSENVASRRGISWRSSPAAPPSSFHMVIIGAGMSGLCAAIRAKEAGFQCTVIEKNHDVAGTWLENIYPGSGVDTPNHFYSYSFAPNADWSRFFAKQAELLAYFRDVASRYDILKDIRFGCTVEAADWDEESAQWRLEYRDEHGQSHRIAGDGLISAVGFLNRWKLPDIEGRDRFEGPQLHTAGWDPEFDWTGKKVGLIGGGASALQVGPTIAPETEQLIVFQRTPHWIVPNPNYFATVSDGKKWLLARFPAYARWYRFQLFWAFADGIHPSLKIDEEWEHPERSVSPANDRHRKFMERYINSELAGREDLIEKLTPDYPPYAKRILIDNHWFEMMRKDNVKLVSDRIASIESNGIRCADGSFHELDAIIYATGFETTDMLAPMNILGRGGRNLREYWGWDSARAFLGSNVPGFPNFFVLTGPNTGIAHGGNQIFVTECQVRYILLCLREMLEAGGRSIEVKEEAFEAYNELVDDEHERMIWTHRGVSNWYRNKSGRVFALMPWRLVDFWKMTSKVDPDDYMIERGASGTAAS